MSLDLSVQPPAWLTRASEEGSDPLRNIRQAQAAANLSETLLQATGMEQQLLSKAQDDRDKALDMQELPKWLREHPKYEDRQKAVWPVPRSRWGESIIQGWQNQDVTSDVRQQRMEQAREQARIRLEQEKKDGALKNKLLETWSDAIASIGDAEVLAQVMPPAGQLPNAKQMALINQYRTQNGMLPVGQKQTEMQKKETVPARVRTVKAAMDMDEEADRIQDTDPEGAAELRKAAEALRGVHATRAGIDAQQKRLETRLLKLEEHIDKTREAIKGESDPKKIAAYQGDLNESMTIRNSIKKELDTLTTATKPTGTRPPAAGVVNPDDPMGLGGFK